MFLYNVDIIQIRIVSLESVHFMWLGKITSKFICQDLSFISITSGVNDCIWVVRNWLSAGQVCAVLWLVAQSCPTLRDPVDCTPPGSSIHGILQARILEWGGHVLLQGIFPTQGLNPGLPHCRRILYCLSHQGSLGGQVYFHVFFKNIKYFHGISPVSYIKIFDSKCQFFLKYQLLP